MNLDFMGRSKLHYAALENNINDIDTLVKGGLQVNLKDEKGFTALHLAAQELNLEATRKLLEYGAYVDSTNIFGNTPLFTAVFNSKGDGQVISLLRKYGANPYHLNNYSQTPIGLARLIDNYNIAQFFSDLE